MFDKNIICAHESGAAGKSGFQSAHDVRFVIEGDKMGYGNY
jgi:hypothetical protein